jgi:4-amino-4-deoxy-L-arabinose transferase-like glycosyltransferase
MEYAENMKRVIHIVGDVRTFIQDRLLTIFKSNTCILAMIIVLAFSLRTYRLQEIPAGLFLDEISAAYYPFLYEHGLIGLSLKSVLSYFLSGTFFTYSLAGSSPFFTRLPEDLIGTLLVFVVYLLAKEMFSKRVGLLSALLTAVSPWAIHFSRFQAFNSSYVLFFVVAVFFLYKGINSNKRRSKFGWYCVASLVLGLTSNILSSGVVFVPLFIVIFLLLRIRKTDVNIHHFFPKRIAWGATLIILFLVAYSPIFEDYLLKDKTATLSVNYSTYSHSQNTVDWFRMILERAKMHLSPGFLVFTAPSTHDIGFQETIGKSGLLRYSPTSYGELNYVAILLYPGILLLVYETFKNRRSSYAVLLGWIVSYSIVSGIAYFDNPSPARNIAGMPALIITIALFIDFLLKLSARLPFKSVIGRFARYSKPLIPCILAGLVAIPTSLFLYDYYVGYPVQSARVFDYGYKQVADFLSSNNLWRRDILINGGFGGDLILSFFSPAQPPTNMVRSIYGIAAPLTSGEAPSDPLEQSLVQISKNITSFSHGIIEYETKIEKGFGTGASSHINLSTKANNLLSLGIYPNNSLFGPNTYLLSQNDSSGRIQFEQRPLNQTIEYGKWYKIRLNITSTAISFYFDGRPITTWSRPSDNNYRSIELVGESAAVSFKNMIIQQNNPSSNLFDDKNNYADWQNVVGTIKEVKQDSNGKSVVSLLSKDNGSLDPSIPLVYASKDLSLFNHGTIDYETRIDKGYHGSTSSDVVLISANGSSHLSLGIYHNTSSYAPNSYSVSQSGNNGMVHFEQRPLNQTIEYDKWYKVRLNITSTAISFYLDGRPITTWSRPSDETYTSIHLVAESAAVSFKNMIIHQNNQQFSSLFDNRNNYPSLQNVVRITKVYGTDNAFESKINKAEKDDMGHAVVKLDPESIIVAHAEDNSIIVAKFGKYAKLMKDVYSPDGTFALSVFLIY